ncbi:MAG: hypothetical protein ABI548_13870 [Polyangiaceae bacterium]
MNKRWVAWGFWGLSPLLGALACSGKNVTDVGDINSAGHAGTAGSHNDVGAAAAPDRIGEGGDAGAPNRAGGGEGGDAGASNLAGGGDAGSMTVSESGGANGGAAGTGGVVETNGGGGAGGVVFQCSTCAVVVADQDVRSVTVSGDKVYGVAYGRYDNLGNYDYNGQLFARDVSGGAQSLVVDGLPGPEEVSVSGDYAYVFVDHRTQPGLPQGLLRVPLSGGAPVEVSTGPVSDAASTLSAAPGYEYWVLNAGLVRTANAANAGKEVVLDPRGIVQVTNDGTTLFFRDTTGIWAKPLAGGDLVQIYAYLDPLYADSIGLAVTGSYLYSIGVPDRHSDDPNTYLLRMPKTGGIWTRLAIIVEGNISELAVDGERLFLGGYPGSGDRFNLYQSTLMAPEPSTLLLTYTATRRWSWAISATGIFYGDDHGLYFTPGAL